MSGPDPLVHESVTSTQPAGADRRPRVVVGVGGGIAAYKVGGLVRLFTEHGADVTVVPTAAALRFVGAATWEALSGHRSPPTSSPTSRTSSTSPPGNRPIWS
ncbi:MAG: flavoprotein [Nakamurella multipartita]